MKANPFKNVLYLLICFLTFQLFLTSCATVGNSFEFLGQDSLIIGKTTQKEVLVRYGDPFRVGFDNGNLQWTYAFYHYSLFDDARTKDLVVTFDKSGIVTNYSYNSSFEEDKLKIQVNRGN